MNLPRPSAVTRAFPRLLTGLLAWFAFALTLTAQTAGNGIVNGRVTDASTRAVLAGAEVTVAAVNARTVSSLSGDFTLSLPAGDHVLAVSYLGLPSGTVAVKVVAGQSVAVAASLGSDAVQLDAFKVTGTRDGQARALNQQRAAQNLTNIISSDLNGQFPDKTIADAVKRLPGVTVETDRDTGGSEGRYITVRGMNADFNAVSINGMRVAVTNFEGVSRAVPLDVVSAKSADQIEVSKALRPDQDGDSIGGAVDIKTRSPFDRDGTWAFVEGVIGYSELLTQYSNYPFKNPLVESAAGYSTLLADGKVGLSFAANLRDRAFVKQRISTGGWASRAFTLASGPGVTGFVPLSVILQDFFDDVTAVGFNTTGEWRPDADTRLRLDFGYSDRETNRGRQRLVVNTSAGSFVGTPTLVDDTYTSFTRSGNRVERNVRDFFEDQRNVNVVGSGSRRLGALTLDALVGFNRGNFDGDAAKDINARFRTATGNTSYNISNGARTPNFSSAVDLFNPANYSLNSLDRGTRFIVDETWTAALNGKLNTELAGGRGFWQFGLKSSERERDTDNVSRFYFSTGRFTPAGFTDAAGNVVTGPILADYFARSSVDGRYAPGFFIDPSKLRAAADTLEGRGLLNPATRDDNRFRSLAGSGNIKETVNAAYAMGQFTWGRITGLAGVRLEQAEIKVNGANATVEPAFGDYTSATPFSSKSDKSHVLPSVHVRFDAAKNLLYRASVTRSLARPSFSRLNPSRIIDDGASTVSFGDINLKTVESTNFDASAEYYVGSSGFISLGVFAKDMKNNVYTERSIITNPAALGLANSTLGYDLSRPRNAKSASLSGVEFAFEQQLTFLPAPFDGLGVGANYTYTDSEIDLGFPVAGVSKLPLFDQVPHTINASIFYDRGGFRARASLLFRDETFFSVDTTTFVLSRYQAPSTTLDLTASYKFMRHWTVFGELSNVLNTPVRAYNSKQSLRLDYNEYSDLSAQVGVRWNW